MLRKTRREKALEGDMVRAANGANRAMSILKIHISNLELENVECNDLKMAKQNIDYCLEHLDIVGLMDIDFAYQD